MKLPSLRVLLLFALVLATGLFDYVLMRSNSAQSTITGDGPDALKVLFIGNSQTYFNDMPEMLARLIAAANPNQKVKLVSIVAGGATLEDHWKAGRAQEAIRHEGPWNFIVLQEQGARAIGNNSGMLEYARQFDAEAQAAGAKTLLFERAGEQARPQSNQEMHRYTAQMARKLGVRAVPCMEAWDRIVRQHPEAALFGPDGSHPGPIGSYLYACVFYATLLGKSPEGLPHQLERGGLIGGVQKWVDVPEGLARDIQRAAWLAVERKPE